MNAAQARPIGVFDSGVGGLTVFRALRAALPHENFVYLGDTARLPYGTKSRDTVGRYTVGAANLLRQQDIKYLVVACNTASALALDTLRAHEPDLAFCGVIKAGAAAAAGSRNGRIAVLATEGTVRSGAYTAAIQALRPDADVQMLACNLLVALVEEGWCEGAEANAVVGRYLAQLDPGYDTLVLGCTHFPLLATTIRRLIPPDVRIVDSAGVTAAAVAKTLGQADLLNNGGQGGTARFLVTDLPERFVRLGAHFLGHSIDGQVVLTGLEPAALPLLAKTPDRVQSVRLKT